MAAAQELPDDVLEMLADFTPKQIQALQNVADQEASSWPSRRDVLKASAIAGGAGTAGAVMSNEGVQQTQATSTGGDIKDVNSVQGPHTISISPGIDTDSLIIGGTLYEEDANSPWTATNTSSDTYTISGTYDEVIVVPDGSKVGFDQLRFNGVSTTSYNYVDNSDTRTTGATEMDLGSFMERLRLFGVKKNTNANHLQMYVEFANGTTGLTAGGRFLDSANLNSITGIDSGAGSRSLQARVYGRSMGI